MYTNANECMETLNKIRLLGKKYMRCSELASAEFFMLVEIGRLSEEKDDGVTNSEIAETMDTTLSAASKMMKNLEEKGYVIRKASSKDRRVVYISVTEKGKDMVSKVREKHEKVMNRVMEEMGAKDMEEFNRLLKKWYISIKIGMEES